jgi:hypothetical protein
VDRHESLPTEQHPMSAATITQSWDCGALPGLRYKSPSNMAPLSFSFMNHGDLAIIDQSPPLSMMRHIFDDGTGVNDMYGLSLPMYCHSPVFLDQLKADIYMDQFVQFDIPLPVSGSYEPLITSDTSNTARSSPRTGCTSGKDGVGI